MSKWRFNNPTVKEQSNNDEELSTIPKYNRNAVRYGSENDSEDLNELERVISSHIPKNLKIRTYNSRLSYEKIKIRGPQGNWLRNRNLLISLLLDKLELSSYFSFEVIENLLKMLRFCTFIFISLLWNVLLHSAIIYSNKLSFILLI